VGRGDHAARRGPADHDASTTHFELLDFASGSALVCRMVALAASPRHEAVARIRKLTFQSIGFEPARGSHSATIRLHRETQATVGEGRARAGRRRRNVTAAPKTGSPEASTSCTTGSCPRRSLMLLIGAVAFHDANGDGGRLCVDCRHCQKC